MKKLRRVKNNEEINLRIGQGRRLVKRLNRIWWYENIRRGRKKYLYNTIVKPILLYEAEA